MAGVRNRKEKKGRRGKKEEKPWSRGREGGRGLVGSLVSNPGGLSSLGSQEKKLWVMARRRRRRKGGGVLHP